MYEIHKNLNPTKFSTHKVVGLVMIYWILNREGKEAICSISWELNEMCKQTPIYSCTEDICIASTSDDQ